MSLQNGVFKRFLPIFFLVAFPLCGQDFSPVKQFSFATWLFGKGEYFRAIGEFERFRYFNPSSKDSDKASYYIALSYHQAEQYADAYSAYLSMTNNSTYGLTSLILSGDMAFLLSDLESAERHYLSLLEKTQDKNLFGYGLSGVSWTKLMRRDFPAALNAYDTLLLQYPNHKLAGDIEYMRHSVTELSKFKPLSPALAGMMSALLPGSGQIYDKRPGDGVVAFLAVGTLGSASYLLWRYYEHKEIAVGFSLVTGFFYAGNIYTAWSSAKKYNKLYYEKHLKYLRETYWRGYKPEFP